MRRLLALATSPLLLTGCLDFVAPDLPTPGPAAFSASLDLTDSGMLLLSARLDPGLAQSRDWRVVPNDSIVLQGRGVGPAAVQTNGSRSYTAQLPAAAPAEVVTLRAPPVHGIEAPPVELSWTPVRRLGRDTVVLEPGADLHVRIDTVGGRLAPEPRFRQWSLGLAASNGDNFQIGGSGPPPTDIDVPARWIPGDAAGALVATLVVSQSSQTRPPPGDYLAAISTSQRIGWVVVRPDSAKGSP
ncbi:MAG TPA: hypothetical protein VFQ38_00140 [Longimicrobiales bacterium]|nr:hypothetical protein [Longimicrobiales bacterium]